MTTIEVDRVQEEEKKHHKHTHTPTTILRKQTENLSIPTSILQVPRTLTHLLLSLFIFFHKFRITFILSDKIWAIKIWRKETRNRVSVVSVCVCMLESAMVRFNHHWENCLHLYMTSLKPMIALLWLRLWLCKTSCKKKKKKNENTRQTYSILSSGNTQKFSVSKQWLILTRANEN